MRDPSCLSDIKLTSPVLLLYTNACDTLLHEPAPSPEASKDTAERDDESLLHQFPPYGRTHAPRNRSDANTPDNLPGQVQRDVEQRDERPDEREPAARLGPGGGWRPGARDAAKVEPVRFNGADGRSRMVPV